MTLNGEWHSGYRWQVESGSAELHVANIISTQFQDRRWESLVYQLPALAFNDYDRLSDNVVLDIEDGKAWFIDCRRWLSMTTASGRFVDNDQHNERNSDDFYARTNPPDESKTAVRNDPYHCGCYHKRIQAIILMCRAKTTRISTVFLLAGGEYYRRCNWAY